MSGLERRVKRLEVNRRVRQHKLRVGIVIFDDGPLPDSISQKGAEVEYVRFDEVAYEEEP